jgi:hypothetical protein
MTKGMAGLAALLAAALGSACGGGNGMMGANGNSPGAGGPTGGAAFMSVSPAAGETGVPVSAPMMFRFSGEMAAGMEQYVDLHVGDLSGPEVGVACGWSAGRTQLTCTPGSSLASHTTYAMHLGGGMTSAGGAAVDYTAGLGMGGQWIMGGMMTGTHGGMGWGMMGGGWRNANGSYGMVFTFTTA